jgi:hypothetical protein
MTDPIKNQIINSYLSQQMMTTGAGNSEDVNNRGAIQPIEMPSTDALKEFKSHVQTWMEIDNTVKKLQAVIRERNGVKNQLTAKILSFMNRFNIEDLNTQEGKLRYKVTHAKVPLNQTIIKNRLLENYGKVQSADELTQKVFERENIIEKHSLRRMSRKGGNK